MVLEAGGFELITRHVAEPARVNGQRFAQHEFHAEIRDAAQGRLRAMLLKPRGRLRRVMLGSQQVANVLAEGGIGQHAFELVPRDGLQDNPGVLREVPQRRIKLTPHFVSSMVPRPAHIQGQLRQGIESLNLRGQKAVYRVADTCLLAHGFSSKCVVDRIFECINELELLSSRHSYLAPLAFPQGDLFS